MNHNRRVGTWGEQAAANYLAERGYEIAARNIRTPYGEIDLIVLKDGLTIFVEVKARTSQSLGPPEIAVTPRKQAHMLACAGSYAQKHGIDHWQIDVIAVQDLDHHTQIAHFENAVS